MRPLGPFEHRGYLGGVAGRGLAVNRHNDVAGAYARLEGRRPLKGREHHHVDDAVLVRLRLDGHANAVVVSVLIFAHLGEGLGVVEIGVRVQHMQHAGDGAVVDGLVNLVLVQRLGVVLLDDGVDVGELAQRIAECGLVGGRLRRDFLADQ